ncbi:MAG: heme ABC exporter ATP-binding protein CcmA, partial [Dehalococcoidia bacterium]
GGAILAQGIYKSFGRSKALRDVDLNLEWGQALALLGHNGAGKTTLLRILTTLARPDRGSVRIAGLDSHSHGNQVRAAIGYVGHQPLLYDDLTPRENLAFYAQLYQVQDAKERTAEVLAQTGADEWADRRVRTLSNGMQKRVALARALLHRPAVLFFDEAETGLDQEGLRLLEEVISGVARGGAAVVFTTHSIERGLELADRLVVLARGAVALAGEVSALRPEAVRLAVEGRAEAVS